MVKAVVLDVDGTLMDTNYLHVEAWARALEEVGHRAPRVEIHPKIGKGSGLLISELVGNDEEAAEKVAELHTEYYSEMQKHAYPLPGAKELIDSLAKQGLSSLACHERRPGRVGDLDRGAGGRG